MDHHDKEKLIPSGNYCYSYTGRVVIDNRVWDRSGELIKADYFVHPEIAPCPFWKGEDNGSAKCEFTGDRSQYGELESLLWDQIKECGVNTGSYFVHENSPPLEDVKKRGSRIKDFYKSLVFILLSSPSGEFTYNGVTYILSKHIINDLKGNVTIL